ncbi:MAG TPA: tetratricopeptide repeat protein [Bacteroidia bacterium]|jgi:tetratricopeptide (TPR) repeat protein
MSKETIKDEPIVDVEQAFTKTEMYIEQNKQSLLIILSAVVVLVGGYFAYKYWYVAGEETKARAEMFAAEDYFGKDSIDYAINGDGKGSVGFLQIVDDYGVTPSGNLAEYYLGMSYLKKGQFQEAIDHLEEFDGKDQIVAPLAIAAIGDANMELGNTDEAITYYLKAAEHNTNKFDSPICLKKAGMAYEEKGNYADAIKIYERIKNEFTETTEGRDMDKYIARAKMLGNL